MRAAYRSRKALPEPVAVVELTPEGCRGQRAFLELGRLIPAKTRRMLRPTAEADETAMILAGKRARILLTSDSEPPTS